MTENCEEGKQVQLLRIRIRKAIDDAVNSLSEGQFLDLYSNVTQIKNKKLLGLFGVLKKNIVNELEKKMQDLIQDEQIDQKLKEREKLIQEQQQFHGSEAWRPTGSVHDDIRAHDMIALVQRKDQLSSMCEKVENDVGHLMNQVSQIRSLNLECQGRLTTALDHWEKLKENVESQQETQKSLANSLITQAAKAQF